MTGVAGANVFCVVIESRERGCGGSPKTTVVRTQVPDPRRTKVAEWGWAEGPDIYAGMDAIFTFARPADFPSQSLIDLISSEKATSDKEQTREGKYINTR